MLAVRTNNLSLALLVKIKVLVAYAVSKNYVVVILLIILSYTALFPLNKHKSVWEACCFSVSIGLICCWRQFWRRF